jgi:hypothetical protein
MDLPDDLTLQHPTFAAIGGGRNLDLSFELNELLVHAVNGQTSYPSGYTSFDFTEHISRYISAMRYEENASVLICNMPLSLMVHKMTIKEIKIVARIHRVHIPSKLRLPDIRSLFDDHFCPCCESHVSIFTPHVVNTQNEISNKWYAGLEHNKKKARVKVKANKMKTKSQAKEKDFVVDNKPADSNIEKYQEMHQFPPKPPTERLKNKIIRDWHRDTSPSVFEESGCAVCGQLTPLKDLTPLSEAECDLDLLCRKGFGMTCLERKNDSDPIQEWDGPVLDHECTAVCRSCQGSLNRSRVPTYALANGLWLGKTPPVLQDLKYAERMLISRVRHNHCVVRVSSGMTKVTANAVTFENPMPKIYRALPPPVEELDQVLAFIYIGPCKPTPDDLKRTPMLVRRNKVAKALEWLKLNHKDYYDLDISYDNLSQYPEEGPPVVVTYKQAFENKLPEATSIDDLEQEDGVEDGDCPFVVHGLTGEQLSSMKDIKTLVAAAVKHLNEDGGKLLAIGQETEPQSIFHNPKLYPQMFPWLFPYGLGGVGSTLKKLTRMGETMHKRRLLMYHDKRFQKDSFFPHIAFNHEQIKGSSTGGYLLADKQSFPDIANRLLNIDTAVMADLSKRMMDGERVKPQTEAEKACFQLIHDLDHVAGRVNGSTTTKKYMRNEIWSLISYRGAPSWFITFAPADVKHPLCLYFADTKETFSPEIRCSKEARRLIANNPVAGARFFHTMVQLFIKHVLGVGTNHRGIYGDTLAYYGTVEQQGRLTLHLHLLLWILGSLTPQEIRDRIMDKNSDFQQRMVEYLESVHCGEFMTGSMNDVGLSVKEKSQYPEYKDPTQTMPEPPPKLCPLSCKGCSKCHLKAEWKNKFEDTVDDLLWRSNVHIHTTDKNGNNTSKCVNKSGQCKARFPRPTFDQTLVDPNTGALNVKKGEAWMNTFTPLLTYLLRSNSDVTSLLSGTAIKAVVAYVSDYITKQSLKTYTIFDTIRDVFEKNSEMIGGDVKRNETARKLFTKVVNSLTAKMEIGAPMASLFLLGNPDHYTDHKFKTFYWKSYVRQVMKYFPHETESDGNTTSTLSETSIAEKVVVNKVNGEYVGLSSVLDYMYRPVIYGRVNLYDWIRLSEKSTIASHKNKKKPKKEADAIQDQSENEEYPNKECSEDDMEQNVHLFLPDHPQAETHQVRMKPDDLYIVPDFVGGALPRSDHDDREYYCATMLTFFQPWRDGKDLKSGPVSWDKTFVNHKFTPRQIQIMNYFNVRYECLDARDDYSTQRQKEGDFEQAQHWASYGHWDALDENYGDELTNLDNVQHDHVLNDHDNIDYEEPSRRYKVQNEKMQIAENVVQMAGWMDKCVDGAPDIGSLKPIEPGVTQSAKSWKAAVQAKKQEIQDEKSRHLPANSTTDATAHNPHPNMVEVVDKSFLDQTFQASSARDQKFIDDTVTEFNLNTEQERAFRIVANHATLKPSNKLRMYLGGMGGTGKSQVIKALMHFFDQRNEMHRFLVVAPTGSAAALLNGSTYHSVLGINDNLDKSANAAKSLAQVRSKLDGVDYTFLDEVSMLACQDMYKISSQMAKSLNVHDQAFGGMNMIFAGDFAQLPPAMGKASLYAGNVGTRTHNRMTVTDQESAVGKALWHQVTTVVILRQNMRQKGITLDDNRLRTALENMRYKSCTDEDIAFLRTRIAGRGLQEPKLAQKCFRNISIITATNAQKDKINQLGTVRFAAKNNQTLTEFYSVDRWKDPDRRKKNNRSRGPSPKYLPNPVVKDNVLKPKLQRVLWNMPHNTSNHIPGKLLLCIGLPIMLRYNDATECCMTKGAEGTVAGWESSRGPEGQLTLDTLFVKLKNPPKTVNIPGLPDNVVPVVKQTTTTNCTLPSDHIVPVARDQVLVLPNFGMTDYASQGRTRPFNPVELSHCTTHQSYYTCLSRSASAKCTIIVQGFDPKKIMGGASGYLRQEFRELEILDEITKLQYDGLLPKEIEGHRRNTIIRMFQDWKGTSYVPTNVHSAIKWSVTDPMDKVLEVNDSKWHIIRKGKNTLESQEADDKPEMPLGYVAAKGSIPVNSGNKAVNHDMEDEVSDAPAKKKIKLGNQMELSIVQGPIGLLWDGLNYSCAYDSMFTILFRAWSQNVEEWNRRFAETSQMLTALSSEFEDVINGHKLLESARDNIRASLYNSDNAMFPYGSNGCNITNLAEKLLLSDNSVASIWLECKHCPLVHPLANERMTYVVHTSSSNPDSTAGWWEKLLRQPTQHHCNQCLRVMDKVTAFNKVPNILMITIGASMISISKQMTFKDGDVLIPMRLRGIVYFGAFHFTSRIVDCDGSVWFHDGMVTGQACISDGKLRDYTNDELAVCRGRNAAVVVYARD